MWQREVDQAPDFFLQHRNKIIIIKNIKSVTKVLSVT